MNGQGTTFDLEWLKIREIIDTDSRNAQGVKKLCRLLSGKRRLKVLDLGCGCGSNYFFWRGLFPAAEQHWTCVDTDAEILGHFRGAST